MAYNLLPINICQTKFILFISLQLKLFSFCKEIVPVMDKLSLSPCPQSRQFATSQQQEKQRQPKGYDAGHGLKMGMLKIIKSTAFRLDQVEQVTLQDVEIHCDNDILESQSESSIEQDASTTICSNFYHTQHSISYLDLIFNIIHKIKPQQMVIIFLLIACILVGPSEDSTYDMGDYSIYQTVYSKHMFKAGLNRGDSEQNSKDFFVDLLQPADQARVMIYLPKSTQKMRKKDERELSYTKCRESNHHVCVDYRLRNYGSMNLQLENWVLDHITGRQRIAFQANINFLTVIVLAAMKIKQYSLNSTPQKIVIIQGYMDYLDVQAIKLSLIENQCQGVVEFHSERQSFHEIIRGLEYIFLSQVLYMLNILPYQQATTLEPSLTFVIHVPNNADSFLVIVGRQISERQIYVIRFQIDQGRFFVEQKINKGSERGINSKETIVLLIKQKPAALSIAQNMPTNL